MADDSLYRALRRPDVRAEYLSLCEVFRTSGRAKRLHHLEEIAAQRVNMNAAVNAIKTAEQIVDEEAERGTRRFAPGFIVQLIHAAAPGQAPRVVDVLPAPTAPPTIEHDAAEAEPIEADDRI